MLILLLLLGACEEGLIMALIGRGWAKAVGEPGGELAMVLAARAAARV